MKEIRVHITIVDAEDNEPLHTVSSYSIDGAIEELGRYERHFMKEGKAV